MHLAHAAEQQYKEQTQHAYKQEAFAGIHVRVSYLCSWVILLYLGYFCYLWVIVGVIVNDTYCVYKFGEH